MVDRICVGGGRSEKVLGCRRDFALVSILLISPWSTGFVSAADDLKKSYTVMPLRCITVAMFPVWKWDRGQLLFNSREIESTSCEAENC